jgi:O-antigen/teichoic acid export membrane protein
MGVTLSRGSHLRSFLRAGASDRLGIGQLWRPIAETTGANVFALGASALGLVITARYLGPEGRGILAAASSWVNLFATLGTFSIGSVIIHHAVDKQDVDWLPEVAGTLLLLVCATTVFAWGLAAFMYVVSGGAAFSHLSAGVLALAFASLPLLVWNEDSRGVLYALGQLRTWNIGTSIGSLATAVGVFAFVAVWRGGVAGALIAAALTNVAIASVTSRHIFSRASALRPNWPTARTLFGRGLQLHLNTIGAFLFTQTSVLILNGYRSTSEVGLYQLAIQLLNFTLVFATSLGAVSYGIVAERGPDAAWPQQRQLLTFSVILAAVMAVLGALLAPVAISVLAGRAFLPSIELFRFVVFALVGATFSSVLASQWIARGLFWQTAAITFAVGVLSLASDFILIPRYGMHGAVVSTLLTYGLSVIANGAMAVWVQRRWNRMHTSENAQTR